MIAKYRRLIKNEDLNPRGTLFGGRLLEFIDEEASIFAHTVLPSGHMVTKSISEIEFLTPVYLGDIITIGCELTYIGKTSITLKCEVKKLLSGEIVTQIDKICFVFVDETGKPKKHNLIKYDLSK